MSTKRGSKAVPPPRPVPVSLLTPSRYNDEVFWQGFRRSAGFHAVLVIAAVVLGVIMPHEPVKFLPSIRVDIVDLPDMKKSDLDKVKPDDVSDLGKQLREAKRESEKQLEQAKKAAAEPKPLPKEPDSDMTLKKEKPMSKDKTKKKEEGLDDAIARIKALEKIEAEVDGKKKVSKTTPIPTTVVKGNRLSKGDSLSGGAATDTNAFISQMRGKLQDNWNLPVWLSTKNLSARVQVFLDASGFVRSLLVEKSSGNAQFDDYCVKTIRMAQPFGAPPDELVGTGIILGFPL